MSVTNNTARVQTEILNDTLKLVELWFPTLDAEEKKKSKALISKVLDHIKEKSVAVNDDLKSKVAAFMKEESASVVNAEEEKEEESVEVEQVDEAVSDGEEATASESAPVANTKPAEQAPLEAQEGILLEENEEQSVPNAETLSGNTKKNNSASNESTNPFNKNLEELPTPSGNGSVFNQFNSEVKEEQSVPNAETLSGNNKKNNKNVPSGNNKKKNGTANAANESTNPFNNNLGNLPISKVGNVFNQFEEEKQGGKRHTSRRRRNKSSVSGRKTKSVNRKK
jgi:hypothetical protein